ncbi:MAG: serpin family protein [Cyanobacteriota bacterium]|nr:serpin family protein [Cyanobacteriota bacterium]
MKCSIVGFFCIAFSAISTLKQAYLIPAAAQETATELSADAIELVEGNSAFALNLYDRLRQEKANENLFFSPYSISTALGMTYAGAREQTELEMGQVLEFPLSQDRLHPAFSQLIAAVETPNSAYRLSSANRLWTQEGDPFEPEFLDLLRQNYNSDPEAIDFIERTELCRQTINAWVEEQTQNRIQELIKPGILDRTTRFVLTNALYFQANWLVPFDPQNTEYSTFTTASGEQIQVPTMYQKDWFEYAQVEDVQILDLPYRDETLSMVILLPETASGLDALEQKLTPDNLNRWLSSLAWPVSEETWEEMLYVEVWLPKFEMTSEFKLKDVLSAMGMPTAFDMSSANFSGIKSTNDLYLTQVVHQAFVGVNETGTEATAATAVMGATRGAPPSIEFRVDRPFIFLIRHRPSGSILFVGRVVNPLTS